MRAPGAESQNGAAQEGRLEGGAVRRGQSERPKDGAGPKGGASTWRPGRGGAYGVGGAWAGLEAEAQPSPLACSEGPLSEVRWVASPRLSPLPGLGRLGCARTPRPAVVMPSGNGDALSLHPSRRGRAGLVPPGLLIALTSGSWRQCVTWGARLAGMLGLVKCPLARYFAEFSAAEPGERFPSGNPAWAAGDATRALRRRRQRARGRPQ